MSDTSRTTDEDIVEKVRSDDRELYAVLIDRYKVKLLRYASYLVHDQDKAAHVVQDAFIKGFINLKGFDTKKRFSSWIYRIVHNEAMNLIKRSQREVPLVADLDIESDEDIIERFVHDEDIAQIGRCLKALPLIYSEPLSLYYLEEKTYGDISEILRIPMGTVAVRINRAKKLMKNICNRN